MMLPKEYGNTFDCVRGHLQTDFGMLNIIMTLRGEGGSGHDVINFY